MRIQEDLKSRVEESQQSKLDAATQFVQNFVNENFNLNTEQPWIISGTEAGKKARSLY